MVKKCHLEHLQGDICKSLASSDGGPLITSQEHLEKLLPGVMKDLELQVSGGAPDNNQVVSLLRLLFVELRVLD